MSWQGDQASYESFVKRHKLTFVNAIDPDGAVFARFGVPAQPAWVFLDSTGVAKRSLGVLSDAKLNELLSKLT